MDIEILELEMFLPYRLNRLADAASREFSTIYRDRHGLTRPEWRTLAALGSVGSMTATEVGAHSNMHKTKVSRAVRTLEQRRWLKRTEDGADRRVEHLELTALGQKSYREITALARTYQASLEQTLGKEAVERMEAGLAEVEKALVASARKGR